MTTNDAFSLLVQATAQLQATRDVHQKISDALKIIKDELDKAKEC